MKDRFPRLAAVQCTELQVRWELRLELQITYERKHIMNNFLKHISKSLLAAVMLLAGASSAFAADAPSLGDASTFAVLSAAPNGAGAVTCTDSIITGDVGSSGAPASVVQTRCIIAGAVIAPVSTQVIDDFNSAYADLKSQTCTGWLLPAYTGATLTLPPGVYCNAGNSAPDAGVTFTDTKLTLDAQGNANAVWIFNIIGAGGLTGTNFTVLMDNGGEACNVYWAPSGAATMTTSALKGNILAGAAITMTAGINTLAGRALAKAAVTLTNATVIGCDALSPLPPSCKPPKHPKPPKHKKCNQGVGNGSEGCDPGDSNHHNSSNDENGGTPGNPGRKGDKK